jgi:very-short-patch-repair endonuclease
MNCENCGNSHDGSYGSGRFCSVKCSRSFSTKNKRKEINKKVSLKLNGSDRGGMKIKNFICQECSSVYEARKENSKFCSRSCSLKNKLKNESVKKKIAEGRKRYIKKAIENGTWIGWRTRRFEPSFPEKYVARILDEMNISYEKEFRINRFFADFAIVDKKIDIEIDGKQHEQRKEHDDKRDSILNKEGWKVYRIKWIFPKDDKIRKQLQEILRS